MTARRSSPQRAAQPKVNGFLLRPHFPVLGLSTPRQSRWSPLWPVLSRFAGFPHTRRPHSGPGGLQVYADGFSTNALCLLNATQGPAQSPQRPIETRPAFSSQLQFAVLENSVFIPFQERPTLLLSYRRPHNYCLNGTAPMCFRWKMETLYI